MYLKRKMFNMATAIKAIPTLYGDEAKRFGEAALQAELRYNPVQKKDMSERRMNAHTLLVKAGILPAQ